MSEPLTAVGEVMFTDEQRLTVFSGCDGQIINQLVRQSGEYEAPLHFEGVQDFNPYMDEGYGLRLYTAADVDQAGRIRRIHGVVDFLVEDWPAVKYGEYEASDYRHERQLRDVDLEDRMRVHKYEQLLRPACSALVALAVRDYSKYRMLSPTYTGIYSEVNHRNVVVQEALLHMMGPGEGFQALANSPDGQTQVFGASLDELDQMLHLRR